MDSHMIDKGVRSAVVLRSGATAAGRHDGKRFVHRPVRVRGRAAKPVKAASTAPVPVYQYRYTVPCNGSWGPEAVTRDDMCASAFNSCPKGQGPLTSIWRRPESRQGSSGGWQRVGSTCLGRRRTVEAAAAVTPVISTAAIRRAWTDTPFAKPGPVIQPTGQVTLPGLVTFFQARWSRGGYRPGQSRTVTLLGQQVRVRPVLRSFDYTFGDGSPVLRTMSAGGPYPAGDVRHTYQRPGSFQVQVSATFTAEYSLNGGSWLPVPGAVRMTGPVSTLRVAAADNRLIPN